MITLYPLRRYRFLIALLRFGGVSSFSFFLIRQRDFLIC